MSTANASVPQRKPRLLEGDDWNEFKEDLNAVLNKWVERLLKDDERNDFVRSGTVLQILKRSAFNYLNPPQKRTEQR